MDSVGGGGGCGGNDEDDDDNGNDELIMVKALRKSRGPMQLMGLWISIDGR